MSYVVFNFLEKDDESKLELIVTELLEKIMTESWKK